MQNSIYEDVASVSETDEVVYLECISSQRGFEQGVIYDFYKKHIPYMKQRGNFDLIFKFTTEEKFNLQNNENGI